MRGTIDRASRVVIPKSLRDRVGLRPGPVEIEADGAAVRIEPVSEQELIEKEGRVIIASNGDSLTDDEVRALRLVDQEYGCCPLRHRSDS